MQLISLTDALREPESSSLRRLEYEELMTLLRAEDYQIAEQELLDVCRHLKLLIVQVPDLRFVLVASSAPEQWFVVSKHEQSDDCSVAEVG